MIISKNDIDFDLIDDKEFEDLCFELLWRLGFENVKWRGGPNDQGRDIEANLNINNPLLGNISENWHIECKKYSGRIPKSIINDKIDWADANKPDKLVFLVSSHLSNQTRDWLKKISASKPYKVYVLEGNDLKNILTRFPDIIRTYFSKGDLGHLRYLMKTWLLHDGEPSTVTLRRFLNYLDMESLADNELIYLFSAALVAKNRVFEYDEGVNEFNFYSILSEFKKRVKGHQKQIIDINEFKFLGLTEDHFRVEKAEYLFLISEFYSINDQELNGYHCIVGKKTNWWELIPESEKSDKGGFEFILYADSNFTTKFRIVKEDAYKIYREVKKNTL